MFEEKKIRLKLRRISKLSMETSIEELFESLDLENIYSLYKEMGEWDYKDPIKFLIKVAREEPWYFLPIFGFGLSPELPDDRFDVITPDEFCKMLLKYPFYDWDDQNLLITFIEKLSTLLEKLKKAVEDSEYYLQLYKEEIGEVD